MERGVLVFRLSCAVALCPVPLLIGIFFRIVAIYVHYTHDAACGLCHLVFVLQPVWPGAVHVNILFYILLWELTYLHIIFSTYKPLNAVLVHCNIVTCRPGSLSVCCSYCLSTVNAYCCTTTALHIFHLYGFINFSVM